MKFQYSIVLLFLSIISGCKLSETYKRPDLNPPANYYGNKEDVQEEHNSRANIPWRTYFKDSLLISLIDTALNKNIDLLIAEKYREIDSLRFKQSKANFYPSISATPFNYGREMYSENFNNYGSNRARRNHGDNPPSTLYTERLYYETGVQLKWEADIWGKLKAQKKASQLAYMQTGEFKKAAQTSLIAAIATAYSNILLLKGQIAIYKKNLSLNDSTLTIVKLQYESGEVTSLAVKQTQSQKLRAQTLIPQLEKEYIILENYLNSLLGHYPHEINIDPGVKRELIEESTLAGMPLELIGNRPDVAASEYNLMGSYEKVGIADAMRYPSVSLGVGTGLNSFELEKLLNPAGSGFLLLNGVIFQPIFQNRKLKTNYEVALLEKEIAELEFKETFLQAINEVSDALVTIDKLKNEYTIAQERVIAAQKAVEDASFLFRSGLANYLEVITAQSEALNSELNLEKVKAQLSIANIELYRSLGGGWR